VFLPSKPQFRIVFPPSQTPVWEGYQRPVLESVLPTQTPVFPPSQTPVWEGYQRPVLESVPPS